MQLAINNLYIYTCMKLWEKIRNFVAHVIFFPDGVPHSTNRNVPFFCSANEKPRCCCVIGGSGSTEGRLSEQYHKVFW